MKEDIPYEFIPIRCFLGLLCVCVCVGVERESEREGERDSGL